MSAKGRIITSGGKMDEVEKFILMTSITDKNQTSAIKKLVSSLKSAGLWNLFEAIYPMVGVSKHSHGINLIDAGKYAISWTGNTSVSTSGIQLSTGYGYTDLNPKDIPNYSTQGGMSVYIQNEAEGGILGSLVGSPRYLVYLDYNLGQAFFDINTSRLIVNAPVTGLKTYQYSNGSMYAHRNGSLVTQNASAQTVNGDLNLGISASGKIYSFIAFHDFIPANKQSEYYSIIQTFQTALGRSV